MCKYNFDEPTDRRGTNSLKLDALKERYGNAELTPMWVADMDFKSPPAITKAIIERANHGIFGYTCASDKYYDSIINWVDRRHDWKIEKEWISYIPGIVKGIAFVIDCFTKSDDNVIIQPPVYHPFRIIPTLHNRKVVYNKLKLEAGQYKMNLKDLKEQINNSSSSLLILCNPHNPAGRVWTQQELIDIAEICYDNKILVISDEIHSDLAFNENKHIPFASVSKKAEQNSITFMAPSKTFNIAGIVSAYSIVPNNELRDKFYKFLESSELNDGTIFAYLAAQAAYNESEEWLDELKKYLWNNIQFTNEYLKKNLPQIEAIIPEASFLIWLDCRKLDLTQSQLESLFVDDAKLALNSGTMFGKEGEGFMRLNIGTQRAIVEKSLDSLKQAINKNK